MNPIDSTPRFFRYLIPKVSDTVLLFLILSLALPPPPAFALRGAGLEENTERKKVAQLLGVPPHLRATDRPTPQAGAEEQEVAASAPEAMDMTPVQAALGSLVETYPRIAELDAYRYFQQVLTSIADGRVDQVETALDFYAAWDHWCSEVDLINAGLSRPQDFEKGRNYARDILGWSEPEAASWVAAMGKFRDRVAGRITELQQRIRAEGIPEMASRLTTVGRVQALWMGALKRAAAAWMGGLTLAIPGEAQQSNFEALDELFELPPWLPADVTIDVDAHSLAVTVQGSRDARLSAIDSSAGVEESLEQLVEKAVQEAPVEKDEIFMAGVVNTIRAIANPEVLRAIIEDSRRSDSLYPRQSWQILGWTGSPFLRVDYPASGKMTLSKAPKWAQGTLRLREGLAEGGPISLSKDLLVEVSPEPESWQRWKFDELQNMMGKSHDDWVFPLAQYAAWMGVPQDAMNTEIFGAILEDPDGKLSLQHPPLIVEAVADLSESELQSLGARIDGRNFPLRRFAEQGVAKALVHVHSGDTLLSLADLEALAKKKLSIPMLLADSKDLKGRLFVPFDLKAVESAFKAARQLREPLDDLSEEGTLQFLRPYFLIVPLDLAFLQRVAGLEETQKLALLKSLQEAAYQHFFDTQPRFRDAGFYSPTNFDGAKRLVQTLKAQGLLGPESSFADAGSGTGLLPHLVNAMTGADATGIEKDGDLIQSARELTSQLAERGVVDADKIHWEEADIDSSKANLTRFDVVYIYPSVVQGDWAYGPLLIYRMRPGALLIIVGGSEVLGHDMKPMVLPNVERIHFGPSVTGYRQIIPQPTARTTGEPGSATPQAGPSTSLRTGVEEGPGRLGFRAWFETVGKWGPTRRALRRFDRPAQRTLQGKINQLLHAAQRAGVPLAPILQHVIPLLADGGIPATRLEARLQAVNGLITSLAFDQVHPRTILTALVQGLSAASPLTQDPQEFLETLEIVSRVVKQVYQLPQLRRASDRAFFEAIIVSPTLGRGLTAMVPVDNDQLMSEGLFRDAIGAVRSGRDFTVEPVDLEVLEDTERSTQGVVTIVVKARLRVVPVSDRRREGAGLEEQRVHPIEGSVPGPEVPGSLQAGAEEKGEAAATQVRRVPVVPTVVEETPLGLLPAEPEPGRAGLEEHVRWLVESTVDGTFKARVQTLLSNDAELRRALGQVLTGSRRLHVLPLPGLAQEARVVDAEEGPGWNEFLDRQGYPPVTFDEGYTWVLNPALRNAPNDVLERTLRILTSHLLLYYEEMLRWDEVKAISARAVTLHDRLGLVVPPTVLLGALINEQAMQYQLQHDYPQGARALFEAARIRPPKHLAMLQQTPGAAAWYYALNYLSVVYPYLEHAGDDALQQFDEYYGQAGVRQPMRAAIQRLVTQRSVLSSLQQRQWVHDPEEFERLYRTIADGLAPAAGLEERDPYQVLEVPRGASPSGALATWTPLRVTITPPQAGAEEVKEIKALEFAAEALSGSDKKEWRSAIGTIHAAAPRATERTAPALIEALSVASTHSDPEVSISAWPAVVLAIENQWVTAAILRDVERDLQDAQDADRATETLLTEAEGEGEVPEPLAVILKDPAAFQRLLALLSRLRTLTHFHTALPSDDAAAFGTLAGRPQALSYGKLKLYLASESFRRHIIGVPMPAGEQRFEIKIPGDLDDRRHLPAEAFEIAKALWERGVPLVEPVGSITAHGVFSLYGQNISFTPDSPLRAFLYRYEDGHRLGGFLRDDRASDRCAKSLGWLPERFRETVLGQVMDIGRWVLSEGYHGHSRSSQQRGGGTDWHLGNFRLLPDGRVTLVGDFESFVKERLSLERQISDLGILVLKGLPQGEDVVGSAWHVAGKNQWGKATDEVLDKEGSSVVPTEIWATHGVPTKPSAGLAAGAEEREGVQPVPAVPGTELVVSTPQAGAEEEKILGELAQRWGLANVPQMRVAAISRRVAANSGLEELAYRPIRMGGARLVAVPETKEAISELLMQLGREANWGQVQIQLYTGLEEGGDPLLDLFERQAHSLGFDVERVPFKSPTLLQMLRQMVAHLAGLEDAAIEEEDLVALEHLFALQV